MYKHHQQSISNLIEDYKKNKQLIGVVLIGSIARKSERKDSDIDIVLVITESWYQKLKSENKICEVRTDLCTYENGYHDIKYFTLKILKSIAEKGSEPARYAFTNAITLFSNEPELENIITKIPVFQESERLNKMLSFYSAFTLAHSYYWGESKNNSYLKIKSISDIILFGLRLLLEDSRILFPSQKGLIKALEKLPYPTKHLIEVMEKFANNPDNDSLEVFKKVILNSIREFDIPSDINKVITRHVEDNELWWLIDRPLIAEW